MAQPQVIQGTREEIQAALDQPEMAGRQLKLIVMPAEEPSHSLLEEAVRRITRRTPEQIAAARAKALETYKPERTIPPGKTFAEVVAGQWPGDESDEQIRAALEDLS